MIVGSVSDDRLPQIPLEIGGTRRSATIDTGFNGDVELPETLWDQVNARFVGRLTSALAGGQRIEEDAFLVDLPFDGRVVQAIATSRRGAVISFGQFTLARLLAAIMLAAFPLPLIPLAAQRDSLLATAAVALVFWASAVGCVLHGGRGAVIGAIVGYFFLVIVLPLTFYGMFAYLALAGAD